MGNRLGVQGYADANYQVVWTFDGDDWCARMFENVEDAQELARSLVRSNMGNGRFQWFAQMMVVVSSADFIDGKRGTEMTVCNRVTLPDGYYGEGR